MAETLKLNAQKREARGSHKARQLRQKGLVPAVVYGHKEETVSIAVSRDDFAYALRHGVRIVDLQTDGQLETAFIREIQWDPFGQEILHVDFTRVSKDERIEVEIALEVRGTAPGAEAGGMLDQPLHTLTVECPAMSVPDSIRVSIGELQLGQAIHVKDLKLPPGVVALNDPEEVVIHIIQRAAEEEEVAPEGEVAEPEVIKREKEEEGGE